MLPVILKEIQSIFRISTFRLLHKLSHNYHFTWHSLGEAVFRVAAIVFPQSICSNIKNKQTDAIQNNNKKRFAIYLKTENG